MQTVFLVFAVLVLVVFPLMGVVNALRAASRARTLVTASPEGIVIEKRGAWRTRWTRLPDDEVRYLHALVARALAGC